MIFYKAGQFCDQCKAIFVQIFYDTVGLKHLYLRIMDFNQIRYFLALANTLNLTRAAWQY